MGTYYPPEVVKVSAGQSGADLRRGGRSVAFYYLLAVLSYAFLFTFWQAEPVPWQVHLAAVLVAATSFLPLARWYASRSEELPMFELVCLSYALQFSMPVYTQPNRLTIMNQLVPIRWDTVFEVLLFVELGLLALMAGYYVIRRSPLARNLPRFDLPLDPQRRRTYLWGALVGGGLFTLLLALNWEPLSFPAFGAVLRLIVSQFALATVLLAYVVYGGRSSGRFTALGLYSAVVFAFVVGLTTGMLENALLPLVLLLVVRWHATGRIPWLAIVAGLVLFLLLNPAKFEYRRQVWYSGEAFGFNERLGIWIDVIQEELDATFQQSRWEETIGESLGRFDLVHRFAYVREMTPAIVPYYHGETYAYFLYGWIPRLLWADKPSASNANQRIDVDYALKYEWQSSTTSIGQLPEAYANFGVVGIAVVMALQGIIFAVLGHLLNGPRSEGGRAIYLVVMAYFLNGIGSSAAILFGALVQYVLASAVILRPFASAWQAREDRPMARSSAAGQREAWRAIPPVKDKGSRPNRL